MAWYQSSLALSCTFSDLTDGASVATSDSICSRIAKIVAGPTNWPRDLWNHCLSFGRWHPRVRLPPFYLYFHDNYPSLEDFNVPWLQKTKSVVKLQLLGSHVIWLPESFKSDFAVPYRKMMTKLILQPIDKNHQGHYLPRLSLANCCHSLRFVKR